MRPYRHSSPQAMARIIAMFMITDGEMDPRELDALEKIMAYDLLGLSRKQFTQVLTDYCDDISDEAEQDGTIHLIDRNRIDALMEERGIMQGACCDYIDGKAVRRFVR